MNKDSLEYLMHVYSVEDGNCFITGSSWALRRDRASSGARSGNGKLTAGKPTLSKRAPGPRLRMVGGK